MERTMSGFPTSLLFPQVDYDNLLVYCDRYYPRRRSKANLPLSHVRTIIVFSIQRANTVARPAEMLMLHNV